MHGSVIELSGSFGVWGSLLICGGSWYNGRVRVVSANEGCSSMNGQSGISCVGGKLLGLLGCLYA